MGSIRRSLQVQSHSRGLLRHAGLETGLAASYRFAAAKRILALRVTSRRDVIAEPAQEVSIKKIQALPHRP